VVVESASVARSVVKEVVKKRYWGIAKLVKAPDFDSGMRRFESFFPSQCSFQIKQHKSNRNQLSQIMNIPRRRSADLINPEGLMLFTGNSNPTLADGVAKHLGLTLGKALVGRFSDGEVMVEIHENVRGKDVFVLQSTCAPTNENLMELMVMVDALKRASAGRITAALPYFGYARQDRRVRSARVAISAKVVANMLQIAGVDRVLTMDLHADQIQGFFDIPVDNIYAAPLLLEDCQKQKFENLIVVSPDVGGVVRARALAKRLDSDLAIIDKRRPAANVSEVMNIIGDVAGRSCIIMDDMVDTAGTLVRAAQALKEHGAVRVAAYCTHAVLSGGAIDRVAGSPLDELVVTDTIPLTNAARACPRIRVLSCAALLGETILRINRADSVSSLFSD
jgi:ribose-phosphate pyrophosphokinase